MPPSSRRPRPATLWLILWVLLGTVHVTQSIWTSGFAALPAGLGDGRFNQLVLEHGYLSWRGVYDWMSPGQFFPVTGTLGWSDTHLGTLPLYVLFRVGGLDSEQAMQAWYLACAVANLLAATALLRRCGFDAWWAPPVAVGAFAGLPVVWATGTHPQLLPLFPALWAAMHAVALAQNRREGWRALAVAGGLTGQFAAAPYLAFFAAVIGGLAVALTLALRRGFPASPTMPPTGRGARFTHLMLAGAGLVAGAVAGWVYLQARASGATRPLNELVELAPTWGAWFAAPHGHWLYPTGWPGGSAAADERLLFGGFLPWVGALFALGLGFRRAARTELRLAALLAAVAGAVVLGFTSWPGNHSPWLGMADWIEPLRAFRAAGRIGGLVFALMFTASGLLLFAWWRQGQRRIAGLLLAALLLETTAVRQHHTALAEIRTRRDALVDAWQAAGDRPVLAWAPGFTNQSVAALHLDAWAAALARHRVTLNGYSGATPPSHQLFYWSPGVPTVEALLRELRFDPAQVSVVTRIDPAAAAVTGYGFRTERPLQHLEGFALQPASWDLLSPAERFEFEGTVFYQFTPNATVSFPLPDGAGQLSLLTGPRPGSWDRGGNSDGYDLRWRVEDADGTVLSRHAEVINPRDNPADRGFSRRDIEAPPGSQRQLVIETGPGPSGLNNWDWPLIGRLRVER